MCNYRLVVLVKRILTNLLITGLEGHLRPLGASNGSHERRPRTTGFNFLTNV
jgi:hypothetical protein